MDAVVEELEHNHCDHHHVQNDYMGLRIAAIFIIGFGSMAGALFPVLARKSTWLHVPKPIFECVALLCLPHSGR
jgi:zinc transporter 1/2/3